MHNCVVAGAIKIVWRHLPVPIVHLQASVHEIISERERHDVAVQTLFPLDGPKALA
jgi:hypothetical protein